MRLCENLNNRKTIPKTAFSFEDTIVSLDASSHDVVIEVSANQLSEKHRHLIAILSLVAFFFFVTKVRMTLTIGVP